jgi:glycosyltransferase involved in cell wall biosynthesis
MAVRKTGRGKRGDGQPGASADVSGTSPGESVAPATGGHVVTEIERLLCGPVPEGDLDGLLSRNHDAWHMRLPGLDSLLRAGADAAAAPATAARICIATEQITGPVRNGGIGSTYANLALLLAAHGFDVTVLYLRGEQVEVATIGHWVAYYAERGVRLVPAPDYARADRFASNADRWLRVPYNMMRWLIDNPMDVVHVSEWRGTGYLCLLAKRQGWAFARTLFLVKTSSPWLWNRLYGGHMLDRADDLVKIHAERRSVELGDVVIGGSLHLLRWMASQGYALPPGRSFVQPNVVTFSSLEPLMQARTLTAGARAPIDEFVFFGRLEVRKGLFIFCQAIRRLVRKGVPLPRRITFMGKPGGRLPSHPDLDTPDYIREVSESWPCEVQILTGFQQVEAIGYLLGGNRLAVMPSIIENSSMAIYEAAICAIPTVATDVGGNAELIDARDRPAVLCQPHPVALADKLHEALREGGMVPRPSFSNDANLATWLAFHRQLGGALHQRLIEQCEPRAVAPAGRASTVCIYYLGHAAALDATLASLAAGDHGPSEVLVGVDADSDADCDVAAAALIRHGLNGRVVECFDLDAGAAFNRLCRAATSEFALFVWEGAQLVSGALAELEQVARIAGADVLDYLAEARELGSDDPPTLSGQFIVGASDAFFRDDAREMPLFVRLEAFARVGGFTTDYRLLGHEQEFVARAQLAGLNCQTVPRRLGSVVAQPADWLRARGYDMSGIAFRTLRPQLAAAPLALRDTMLLARGMATRGGARLNTGSTTNPEGVLMRILAGLNKDVVPVPERPRRPVAPPKSRGSPGNASLGGFLALIDMADNGELPMPVKPRARVAVAASKALKALVNDGEVRRAGDLVGQVLALRDNRIHGWAARLGKGAAPVAVDLIINGQRRTVTASDVFAPFAALPPEACATGFVIDLPSVVPRRRGGTIWRVMIAGTDLVLGEGVTVPRGARPDTIGLDAGLDAPGKARDVLAGWARMPADPVQLPAVALFADDAFVTRVRADAAGRFAVAVPEPLRNPVQHRLDLVLADSGLALRAGRAAVNRAARRGTGSAGVFAR